MWTPGQPITPEVPLAPLLACIGIGQQDAASYKAICEKLAVRNCVSVANLLELELSELTSMIRPLELQKNPLVYVTALGAAINHEFKDSFDVKLKKLKGGDMSKRCTKLEPTSNFNPWKHEPDGRVYLGLPNSEMCQYLSAEDAQLYLDRLWLDAQLHPEPSYGEYLPQGMGKQLKKLHQRMLLPAFRPDHLGKPYQKNKDPERVFVLRFQNGRQAGLVYRRIILDESFKERFGPKVVDRIVWVESTSEDLIGNVLNDFVSDMIDVYAGKKPVRACPPCSPMCS